MINIAIIEDNAADANLLRSYIDRYFAETDKSYKVEVFSDGFNFLSNYSGKCNIAFFDIEMPHIDGMQVARRLRAVDSEVSIIFVTNMAKYAINGYEVSALDFIIKPVEYFLFHAKMDKAVRIQSKYAKSSYVIECPDKIVKLKVQNIFYVESDGHFVLYHTEDGVYRERNTIKEVEAKLAPFDFVRCNNSYLINLDQITLIKKDVVEVGGDEVPISRSFKKSFMNAVTAFNCGR